jgi:hypothetical protein
LILWWFREAAPAARSLLPVFSKEQAMSNPITNRPISLPFTTPVKPAAQNDSGPDNSSRGATTSATSSSTEAEFLKFARMTPEERVQAAILAKLGMSEEQFNKLDSKAKADVMSKIRDEMLKQMQAKGEGQSKTGALADIRV